VDANALHVLYETAEQLRDPDNVPVSQHVKFEDWWDELLQPKITELVEVEKDWYMQCLYCLAQIPCCGYIFDKLYERKRINNRQVAIELAKGYRRTLRHVWHMLESSGHTHHADLTSREKAHTHLQERRDELIKELVEANNPYPYH
jgi:hypothetical protein